MKHLLKRFILKTLTICYALIGFTAHYPAIDEITNYFFNNKQFSSKSKSYPLSYRPIWTKQKHYPPNTITKISDQLIPTNIPIARNINIVFIFKLKKNIISSFYNFPSAKPRDPPIA